MRGLDLYQVSLFYVISTVDFGVAKYGLKSLVTNDCLVSVFHSVAVNVNKYKSNSFETVPQASVNKNVCFKNCCVFFHYC